MTVYIVTSGKYSDYSIRALKLAAETRQQFLASLDTPADKA